MPHVKPAYRPQPGPPVVSRGTVSRPKPYAPKRAGTVGPRGATPRRVKQPL